MGHMMNKHAPAPRVAWRNQEEKSVANWWLLCEITAEDPVWNASERRGQGDYPTALKKFLYLCLFP